MAQGKRLIPLDLLRAVAVVLVMGRHAALFPETAWHPLFVINRIWYRGGWIGVDLFFVLSGFLVSGLLFREYVRHRRVDMLRFVIRRGFKIYPAFYFLLIATVCIQTVDWKAVLCEALFLQNYGPSLWKHTWSLAVEEHFYLTLPLLFIYLARRKKGDPDPFTSLPRIVAFVGITLLLLRILTNLYLPYHHKTHIYPTHLRADALFFGVLLSYYYHFHHDALEAFVHRHYRLLTLAGVLASVPPFLIPLGTGFFMPTFGLAILYIGFGALLLVALMRSRSRYGSTNPAVRFCAYVGSHSYSIYLWHIPVAMWGIAMLPEIGVHLHYLVQFSLYIVLCVAWGIFTALGIEFPMLRFRDRLFPSRSDALKAN